MENNDTLNRIANELTNIREKTNRLQLSEITLELVEAQLKNVSLTLEVFEELKGKNEAIEEAEETIPVDIKEVAGMSLENTAPEVAKQPELIAVAEKKIKPAKAKEEKTDNSLGAKMKSKPIKDLKTAIGINEKFAFIKLFGGDATAWTNALQKLNSFSAYWEAEAMLTEFSQKYKWKEDDETLQVLTDLVQRRYL